VAYDEKMAGRVRTLLGRRRINEMKMFGGLAFLVNGKMCVTIDEERIMVRIDPADHDAIAARPGAGTMTMRGRDYRGYVRVDNAVLKTEAALARWIDLALAFNAKAKASKKK
jgi:TfoX/Sxy family transcriptional regulator of competence genes